MFRESIRPSSEVDAFCTRCKMVTNHRVVAMQDDAIKRVICLTCQGQHNYRRPPGEKAPKTEGAKRIVKDQKRARTQKEPETFQKWLNLKEALNGSEKVRPYAMSEAYSEGEAVEHSKFGLGFVQKLLNGNKIEIMFQTEVKTLVMNHRP